MSKRIYRYHHPQHGSLEVAAGWNRPLQGFFLNIKKLYLEPPSDQEEQNRYLFSNLDPESFPAHLQQIETERITCM